MKKNLFILTCYVLMISCGSSCKSGKTSKPVIADPTEYAKTITSDELKEMLYKYASDEFEGRDTGEKGQKLAVEYLKSKYKALGIPSPMGKDNYFQEVPLEKQKIAEASLSINGKTYPSFDDQIVLRVSKSMDITTNDVVYAGYGIDTDNYSDYKNIDVKGKVVLVKSGEPKDTDGNYITSGNTEDTKWSGGRQALASKRDAAKNNGAKAIIIMDVNSFAMYAPYYKRMSKSDNTNRLSLKDTKEDLAYIMVNETVGKALNPGILEDDTPKTLDVDLKLSIERKADEIVSENVVAYIEGSEKPKEIIVISAHLDHIGVKEGEIYNGADDDGSGTVALLEIAEAFKMAKKAGNGPKRSILFLHVTGEEKGLLGSRHYTDNDPIFPLENTVADLNIDMIGRVDPKREGDRNYIYLIGSDKLSTDLHNISEAVNDKYSNIELDYKYNDDNDPNRFYYRSDHYNFAKNNIPVIFYFNGTHDDYHKPTDTPDKIEYDLLENRARLIFYTAWELANRTDRIVVDKAAK